MCAIVDTNLSSQLGVCVCASEVGIYTCVCVRENARERIYTRTYTSVVAAGVGVYRFSTKYV